MKKRWYVLSGVIMMVICFVYIATVGSRYVVTVDISQYTGKAEQLQVNIEQDKAIITLTDQQIENDNLYLTIESNKIGRAVLTVLNPEDSGQFLYFQYCYVHHFGVITEGNFFGNSTGGWIIPVAVTIYMAMILCGMFVNLHREVKHNLYQYKNVRILGMAVFLSGFLIDQIWGIFFLNGGVISTVSSILGSAGFFSWIVLPLAFIIFLLVTVSNIQLMRKEGRSWRNMLGCILGIMICFGTLFPDLLGEWLQRTTLVNVHNQNGTALYIEMFVENSILVITSYFECILIGTVILGLKAARKIPAFDKDYILILGCQIKKDGTLTNLLKGRADRAVEFAEMQKKSTGKEIVFVPSGGKGDDEVISEAEAIRNYLVEQGIPESRILVEKESANTYENLKNSMELIGKHTDMTEPKIAFSTTNYHVFRAGIFAAEQGIYAEGIGAKTKSYFWINAFIREFIATLHSEWKKHLAVIGIWLIFVLVMIGMVYFSNNL